MKRIYIEGLGLVDGHFSGVGQYILGILRGLDELIDELKYQGRAVPEIKVIIPYDEIKKFKRFQLKHIGYKVFPLSFRTMGGLWSRGKLPPIDLFCGPGVYFFTRFVSMPLLYSRSATVIYDLSYALHREYSHERNAEFLTEMVGKTIKKNDRIITISENAKQEIVEFYSLEPEKIVIAYPAADQRHFYRRSTREIENVKLKYHLPERYILALSNLEPRKNLKALVDAYCALPKSVTDKTALLLVGVSGWKTEALFDHIIEKVNAGYNIIRPSKYVTDADKPAVISGSDMLVYPSHYEGFGMPPLEALACGVPVITANNSSLPEAVGDAAVMIDSGDSEALREEIEHYIKNRKEISASALRTGPTQAEKFSWKKSAKILLDLAEELQR